MKNSDCVNNGNQCGNGNEPSLHQFDLHHHRVAEISSTNEQLNSQHNTQFHDVLEQNNVNAIVSEQQNVECKSSEAVVAESVTEISESGTIADMSQAEITILSQSSETYTSWSQEHTIRDSTPMSGVSADERPIPVSFPIALTDHCNAVYTTRLGGVSHNDIGTLNLSGVSDDARKNVLANRCALAQSLGKPLVLVKQVHSAVPFIFDDTMSMNCEYGFDASGFADPQTVIRADAIVTTRHDVALGVFAADCLPMLLADERHSVIAAVHCGRLGLQSGVVHNTIEAMLQLGAVTSDITATLGPAICGDCYEVGNDIADEFSQEFPTAFTLTTFGGAGVDLFVAAREALQREGIQEIVDSRPRVNAATQYLSEDAELSELCNIDNEGPQFAQRYAEIRHSLCTLENPLWYSHRRAQLAHKASEGRMLGLVMWSK